MTRSRGAVASVTSPASKAAACRRAAVCHPAASKAARLLPGRFDLRSGPGPHQRSPGPVQAGRARCGALEGERAARAAGSRPQAATGCAWARGPTRGLAKLAAKMGAGVDGTAGPPPEPPVRPAPPWRPSRFKSAPTGSPAARLCFEFSGVGAARTRRGCWRGGSRSRPRPPRRAGRPAWHIRARCPCRACGGRPAQGGGGRIRCMRRCPRSWTRDTGACSPRLRADGRGDAWRSAGRPARGPSVQPKSECNGGTREQA